MTNSDIPADEIPPADDHGHLLSQDDWDRVEMIHDQLTALREQDGPEPETKP